MDKFARRMARILSKNFDNIKIIDNYEFNDVEVKEYTYIDDGNPFHKMNVYKLKNEDKKLPLLIDVHGGGWISGDKEQNRCINSFFARNGVMVVSFSYRLVPDVHLKEEVKDVHDAISYILSMDDYDKENIFIKGDSAGGHLLLLESVINNSDKLLKLFDFKKNNVSYKKIVLNHPAPETDYPACGFIKKQIGGALFRRMLYGEHYKKDEKHNYYSFKGFMEEWHISSPVLLVTSSSDSLAGFQIKEMEEEFNKHHVDYILYNKHKEEHIYNIMDIGKDNSKECNQYILDFLKK